MDGSTRPFWLTAFIDYPDGEFERGTQFWTRVTGWPLSGTRGEHDEFASFLPPDGADYLRVQRLGSGSTRLHLDVHVRDPEAAALAAQERGATLTRQVSRGLVVMASPAGFPFCLTSGTMASSIRGGNHWNTEAISTSVQLGRVISIYRINN